MCNSILGAPAMMADLKPGDRFEIVLVGSTDRLRLPAVLGPDGFAIEQIEDADGTPTGVRSIAPAENSLIVPKLAEIASNSAGRIVAGISRTWPIPFDRRTGIARSFQW